MAKLNCFRHFSDVETLVLMSMQPQMFVITLARHYWAFTLMKMTDVQEILVIYNNSITNDQHIKMRTLIDEIDREYNRRFCV